VLYTVLTVLVVTATANHYLLDVVAGIADVALAEPAVPAHSDCIA
jgi:hypothetical protein